MFFSCTVVCPHRNTSNLHARGGYTHSFILFQCFWNIAKKNKILDSEFYSDSKSVIREIYLSAQVMDIWLYHEFVITHDIWGFTLFFKFPQGHWPVGQVSIWTVFRNSNPESPRFCICQIVCFDLESMFDCNGHHT